MLTKIRWPKISQFLLTLVFLSTIPLTAEALEVKFCVPSCAVDATPQTRGPGTPSTVSLVTTTVVTIPSFTYKGFTISGTVTAQQSGTLQKIAFNPTAVTAIAGSGCNTTATNPCRLEIIATSHVTNFPTPKPTGGYPAGVFMAGFFTGTQAAKPNGDTISMTAEASGLKQVASIHPTTIDDNDALNKAVINATPGTTGDSAVSLPSSCTGSPACLFTATTAIKSFNSQITETVQQKCDTGFSTCLTRLRTRVNISIKTPLNKVNLPTSNGTVDSEAAVAAGQNPLEVLNTIVPPPLDSIDVRHLLVFRNNFALDARFTLDVPENSDGINPDKEEVYLRVGPFGMTIPAFKFKKLLQGKLYTFLGKVDGLDVAATFTRGTNPAGPWTLAAAVHGVNLKTLGLAAAPAQVSVDLGVGNDTGRDLVTAAIFQ